MRRACSTHKFTKRSFMCKNSHAHYTTQQNPLHTSFHLHPLYLDHNCVKNTFSYFCLARNIIYPQSPRQHLLHGADPVSGHAPAPQTNVAMVTKFPVLQQLHLVENGFLIGFSLGMTPKFCCRVFSFLRFQVLLKKP